MGKSRKRSRHYNTGYPYSVRVAHIHVVRPKVRRQSDSSLFIGTVASSSSGQLEGNLEIGMAVLHLSIMRSGGWWQTPKIEFRSIAGMTVNGSACHEFFSRSTITEGQRKSCACRLICRDSAPSLQHI